MFAIILSLAVLSSSPEPAASAATLPALTADQRAAYERGQSYERVILANVDRKWYGVALLHKVFEADLDAIDSGKDFPASGDARTSMTDPLRAYLESGDQSSLPQGLADANEFEPYPKSAPKGVPTWWYTEAGMADADIRGAAGNYTLEALAATHPAWLRDHASLGGAYADALGIGGAKSSNVNLMELEPKIEAVFEGAVRTKSIVPVMYPAGPMGIARFGVSDATVLEMIDSPSLLAQPGSQAFVDSFVDEMKIVGRGSVDAAKLVAFRKALLVDDKFDHSAALDAAQGVMIPIIRSLSQSDKGRFVVGMFAAQSAYNAVSLRDPNAAGEQLGALGNFTDLDTADPTVRDLRTKLAAVPGGDWADVIKLGRALVDEIEKHP